MPRKSKALKALEKELADNSYLLRQWHVWHREQREEAVAGPHGALVELLLDILRELTLHDGARLVEFIRAQDWNSVDYNVRLVCLHELNAAITRLRVKAGMPPFDDGFRPNAPPHSSSSNKD
jgi:hypothetical protein